MPAGQCQSNSTKFQYDMLNENVRATSVLDQTAAAVSQQLKMTADPRERASLLDALNQIRGASNILYSLRPHLLSQVGIKFPRPTLSLLKLAGLSPGTITVWHDAESGWFTEARAKDGAPPVYHHVTDEVAVAVLKGQLTHELEAELMKPDDYQGE